MKVLSNLMIIVGIILILLACYKLGYKYGQSQVKSAENMEVRNAEDLVSDWNAITDGKL